MLQRELKRKAKRCCCVSDFAAAAEKVGALESKAKEIAVKEVGRPKQQFVFDDLRQLPNEAKPLLIRSLRQFAHGEVLQELEKAVTSDNPQAFAEIPTSPTEATAIPTKAHK